MSISRSRTVAPYLVVLGLAAAVTSFVANRCSAARPARIRAPTPRRWSPGGPTSKKTKRRLRARCLNWLTAKDVVPFLKGKMKPLRITSGQAKALLLKLNSADEHLWKTAFEELEYFDPRLAIKLPEMMDRVTQAPARQRLVELMSERAAGSLAGKEINLNPVGEGYNFFSQGVGSWWAEPKVALINSTRWGNTKRKWTRAERTIVVLKHIGTPEAISILRDMATGHPDAQPTRVAKETLTRVASGEKDLDACWANLEKGEVDASLALLELYAREGRNSHPQGEDEAPFDLFGPGEGSAPQARQYR